MTDVVVFARAVATGKTEQLGSEMAELVTLKRRRPTWQAVRRQVSRERKIMRTLGLVLQ